MSLRDFFAAVLRGLGAPVTENNLAKLGAVARLEGHGGDYNPFNYILGPGTNFNSVGVKNYPDVATGVAQTVRLLKQGNTRHMRDNLLSNGSYNGWLNATSNFYQSWGGPRISVAQNHALQKLNEQVDGPRVAQGLAALGGAVAGAAPPPAAPGGGLAPMASSDPNNWLAIQRWMDTEVQAFNNYLSTLQPADQQKLIDSIKQPRTLPQVAEFLNAPTTAPETRRYITEFLAKLPDEQKDLQKGHLKPLPPRLPAPPTRPAVDPAMSAELQQLLKGFGVDYPNAPAPTPALLAFLRGVGSSLSTAEDLKRRAVEQIGMRATAATQDVERQSERGKQSLTSDLIRRSVLASGEANTRYARHAEDLGEARANIERERVSGVTQADFAFQQSRDAARQQALERTLGVEERQQSDFATANAQYEAMLAQTRAADAAWERERKAMEESIKRQEDLMRQYASSGVVL